MAKFVELKANAAVTAADLFGGFRRKEHTVSLMDLLHKQEATEEQKEPDKEERE